MNFQQILEWAKADPRKVFQIDGAGAILSAVLLGVVLTRLESVFGIPRRTLFFLASLPCLFAIYDFYCYLSVPKDVGLFIKRIAFANLVYCCISVGLAIYHWEEITILGWIYILIEVVLVGVLASIELRIANGQMIK